MRKNFEVAVPINVGGSLNLYPLKPGRFSSGIALSDRLKELYASHWPKDAETLRDVQLVITSWFDNLHPTMKVMLQSGELTMIGGIVAAEEHEPAKLVLVPHDVELDESGPPIEHKIQEVDLARINAEKRSEKINRLLELGDSYGSRIDELMTSNPELQGVYQLARGVIDRVLSPNYSGSAPALLEVLSHIELNQLNEAMGLPVSDDRGGSALKRFRREWTQEKLVEKLRLEVTLPDYFDRTKDQPVPSSATKKLAAVFSENHRERQLKKALSNDAPLEIEFEDTEKVNSPDITKWRPITTRAFKDQLIELEKLADLLCGLEKSEAVVDYLRALALSPTKDGSLLSMLIANAGKERLDLIKLHINTGGILKFKSQELEKIYVPGYQAFKRLTDFFKTHDRLWKRISLHQATPKT